MRDHSKHVEVSRDKATGLLLGNAHFSPRIETIAVSESCGRVLAKDAIAQLDMPNCLTCNMDSVAVHWDDFKDGEPDTSNWVRGQQWQFANTGIGMPEGFDTAIVIEHVILSDDLSSIEFDAFPTKQYAGTSPRGSRMHEGDVLVPAGQKLTPLLVSMIASGNNATVDVIAKPKVGFIPTGGELVVPGSDVPRAKNIETNSLLAKSKIEQWGGECEVWDIVPDIQELIKQAVVDAASRCDIVVLNAGSSKGSDDWNIEMLDEVGTVLYHQTNHGPGHHSSGAVVDGTPIVGISGPPAGAAFTIDFYLYPLIMQFLGQDTHLKTQKVCLTKGFPQKVPQAQVPKSEAGKGEVRPSVVQGGADFFGVKQLQISQDEETGVLMATPASSMHLKQTEAEKMDCYYMLKAGGYTPDTGDVIEVELRP